MSAFPGTPEPEPVIDANLARRVLASLPKSGPQRLDALQQVAEAVAASGDTAAMLEAARLCLTEAAQAFEGVRDEREQARSELADARALQARLELNRRIRPVFPDIGEDLRPDPRGSRTPADLIEALRTFRTWSGNPSFRRMWRRSGQRIGMSTMYTVLSSDTLPGRLDVIDAIVQGCEGTEEDRRRFATAWRHLAITRGQPRMVRPVREAYKTAAG